MTKHFKKILSYLILSILFLFFSCQNDTKKPHLNKITNNKITNNKITNNKITNNVNKLNKWNINSVCDCFNEGIKNLSEAYNLRNSYNTFEEYKLKKTDVKKVKTLVKNYRSIQAYCLQNYKRAMFENNCDPDQILKNKQQELFKLGIQTSKY